MATLKKRFGASIFLTVLSLASIILLLARTSVHTQLQKIGLGSSLSMDILSWGKTEKGGNGYGARVVVFGDNWVDDSVQEGKGRSWTRVLCNEVCFQPDLK
jgi:hypothetical protein